MSSTFSAKPNLLRALTKHRKLQLKPQSDNRFSLSNVEMRWGQIKFNCLCSVRDEINVVPDFSNWGFVEGFIKRVVVVAVGGVNVTFCSTPESICIKTVNGLFRSAGCFHVGRMFWRTTCVRCGNSRIYLFIIIQFYINIKINFQTFIKYKNRYRKILLLVIIVTGLVPHLIVQR